MANAFFNANYYLAKNPDLVRAGLHTEEQLWNHYVNYGAQENFENKNEDRNPNAWFDVNYYLGSYPDLIAAGVTAAQALDHYFTYGINEGRQFNATIRTSDFTADAYAAKNADVREALGIEEDAELTAQDKANLLKHYLAWGYAENREDAGAIAAKVNAKNELEVKIEEGKLVNNVGTIAADEFHVNSNLKAVESVVIDGLGGDDTVRFGKDADANAFTLRNVETVVVDAATVTTKVESKLNSVKLEGTANATLKFDAALVAGSDDVLNVSAKDTGATLTVNGFETVNVALGGKADTFTLNANKSAGSSQTVKLTGGNKDASAELTFNNKGSSKLTDLTIDGSGLATGLDKVELTDEALNIKNVVVKGSTSAKNVFDVKVDDKQSLTVIGGDKEDTFTATTAIETFTGGKGNDTFVFTAATAKVSTKTVDNKAVINGVDTITDFKKGDALNLGEVEFSKLTLETGEEAGLKTLDDWVAKAEVGNGFNFGGDAYILLDKAEGGDTALIKLAGVNVDSFFKDGATQTNDDGNFIFA